MNVLYTKGLSLTDFMISSAYDAAFKVLDESQVVLTLGQRIVEFFESLLHPRDASALPELQNALIDIAKRWNHSDGIITIYGIID